MNNKGLYEEILIALNRPVLAYNSRNLNSPVFYVTIKHELNRMIHSVESQVKITQTRSRDQSQRHSTKTTTKNTFI